MEGGLMYHIMAWWFLVCIGIYHIYCSTRNYLLKSPPNSYYSAKPYHPLSCSFSSSSSSSSIMMMIFRHLELYIVIGCLIIALIHQLIVSSESDPLLKGGVHPFTSLQSAAVIFLFLLLSFSLLLLPPLSTDLVFALAASFFYLHSSSSSSPGLGLQSECDSLSARISALSSILCLALACFPRLYVAEVGLGATICLQGQWALQTGLSLHADAFIPLGCHKLLDVASGIQGSTKCDLDESNIRAVALLDLMFVVHVVVVVVVVVVVYATIARKNNNNNNNVGAATITNTNIRRFGGSYEALPTTTTTTATSVVAPSASVNITAADSSHIQMKAMTGTQA